MYTLAASLPVSQPSKAPASRPLPASLFPTVPASRPAIPGGPGSQPIHRLSWLAAGVALLMGMGGPAAAASLLGSAQSYAVLSGATVTNAHNAPNTATQVWGDLGVAPGSAVTGFYPDGTVTGGTIHLNDASAQAAMADASAAYGSLAGMTMTSDLTGHDLGTTGYMVLSPGVYHFDTSAQISGDLVLDFMGQSSAQFVFQIGSTLTTSSGVHVSVINGSANSAVYWQVGSSATLGTDSLMAGNILANSAVSLNDRAGILCGRAIGLTAGVTLIDNQVSSDCSAENFGSSVNDFGSQGLSGVQVVPEPDMAWLMVGGLALLGGGRRWKRSGRAGSSVAIGSAS